jgi:hypothetical protein
MFTFDAAAEHSQRAAAYRWNYTRYFEQKEILERHLYHSQRNVLSHMEAENDTAKAESFNCLSNAVRMHKDWPTKIGFESVQRGLFIASVFAQRSDLDNVYLPEDSNAPQEYFKRADGREWSSIKPGCS